MKDKIVGGWASHLTDGKCSINVEIDKKGNKECRQ
jgi:hypothetical protein